MDLKGKKIITIIAHPDDETIGCGGFLSKASRLGAECKVLLPLRRSNERYVDSWNDEIENFKSACDQLGVTPVIAEDLVCDAVSLNTISKISNSILKYINWADIVICHWKGDLHHAHQSIASAVELATRPFKNAKTVFCFEIATSTDQGFENTFFPNCFIAIDEIDMQNKKLAMKCYESEIFSGRTPEDLEHRMRYRGSQSGSKYAEAFLIARYHIK